MYILFTKLLFKLSLIQKRTVFLVIISISNLFIFGTVFVSCVPENIFGDKTSKTDSTIDEPSSDSDSSDRDRDRDRETCGDSESCEDVCYEIYDRSTARNKCKEEDRNTVDKLEQVHAYLEENDVEEITDEGLLKDFKKYLEISVDEWITHIKYTSSTRTPSAASDAKDVLKWLAENENAAEKLLELDDKKGEKVLEALIGKLNLPAGTAVACAHVLDTTTTTDYIVVNTDANIDPVVANVAATAAVKTNAYSMLAAAANDNENENIKLNGSKIQLYKKFLCQIKDVKENIFILSDSEGNEELFKLATNTLTSVCGSLVDDKEVEECVNFIKCWSLEYKGSGDYNISSSDYNKYDTIQKCTGIFRAKASESSRDWKNN